MASVGVTKKTQGTAMNGQKRTENGSFIRQVRESVRTVARKDNFLGHCCSMLVISFRENPNTAWEKVVWPQLEKRALKRFGRKLGRSADEPGETVKEDPTIRFSVLVPLYNTPSAFLEEMIRSVQVQTWPNWELCLADGSDENHPEVRETCERMAAEDPRIRYRKLEENKGISENTNACIDLATGDFLALLDHDDLLHPEALAEAAKAIREEGADFVYTDEVVFESPDKCNLITAHFKPDYAPESLLTNNYICHLSVFKASLLERTGRFRSVCDGSQDYDIILRLTDSAEKVVHIPRALYFWRSHATSTASGIGAKSFAAEAGKTALKDFLRTRKGTEVFVESTPEYPTLYHVSYPLKESERVDLILDMTGKTNEEIQSVLKAVCDRTAWEQVCVTVISDDEPSEISVPWPVHWVSGQGKSRTRRLNEAAGAGTGAFLVFLDADLMPENRNWLPEMLMLAQQEQIGAVGGKGFFDNGRIRHGGLILGLGKERLVGRSSFEADGTGGGYFGQLAVVENMSAVSAECMAISRTAFEDCGGFDEAYRGTLFDVDLCLKLRHQGYRNLFTPHARFRGGAAKAFSLDYGRETAAYPADAETLRTIWKHELEKPDRYYNPNLTTRSGNFSIK